jgi:hypothetical protein
MSTFTLKSILPKKYKSYTHIQNIPNSTWTIDHNLDAIPLQVLTFNEDGDIIKGKIDYITATNNSIDIIFSVPLIGTAKLFG